ncbi:MAG TPA: TolC family protein [Bryobacteraceae bacterium]|nr:TolC family protein [Bryobacteraceae bacterium]
MRVASRPAPTGPEGRRGRGWGQPGRANGRGRFSARVTLLPLLLSTLTAQDKLTLREAEDIALKNHPRVSVSLLNQLAANQVVLEVRSARLPTFFGSVTGAGALSNSRLAAGALNNPIIYNRLAGGVTGSQLITDFGRTSNLTESASLRARGQSETVKATRADVVVQVDRAYFAALRAQSVSRVAQQTVSARQTSVDQVSALAQSKLKSELDLSFANVNLSEAKLLLISAQNEIRATFADLSMALGYPEPHTFVLTDEPLPPALDPDPSALGASALTARPDLAQLRLEAEAAKKFAEAERDLSRPTLAALGSVGYIPTHASQLPDRYGAAGVNLNIPIFNGRLFAARRTEADLRAQAVQQQIKDLQNRIRRDVEVAWLNATTAHQRMAVTAELLEQATKSLDLAQARYDLGLSSIVELSQAQLNKTSAEIAGASARYEYQIQRSVLNYQIGVVR